mmetsp:Transcript_21039/g.60033  ORF Transcript_21039/g.60033 Transcript_21039/m.60033 type:complete len:257 (+) Transcript_21039:3527-4297(+)
MRREKAVSARLRSCRILMRSCVPELRAIFCWNFSSLTVVFSKTSQKEDLADEDDGVEDDEEEADVDDGGDSQQARMARPASLPATTSGVMNADLGTVMSTSSLRISLTARIWHPMVRSYNARSATPSTRPTRPDWPKMAPSAAGAGRECRCPVACAAAEPFMRPADDADADAAAPDAAVVEAKLHMGAFLVPSVASPLTTHTDGCTTISVSSLIHSRKAARRWESACAPPPAMAGDLSFGWSGKPSPLGIMPMISS